LPVVQREEIEAHLPVAALPSLDDQKPATAPTPVVYRGLTGYQCQCLAAAASSLAKLHNTESEQADRDGFLHQLCGKKKDRAELQRAMSADLALEDQNRAAGTALELYYRLAEAEARADLLKASQDEVESALQQTRKIVEQNLRPRVELDTLLRQQLSLRSDEAQLQLSIDQANGELRQRLAVQVSPGCERIWPLGPFELNPEPVDVDAAVSEGLALRPELVLLRRLLHDLDASTLPAARGVLQSINPLLGADPRTQMSGPARLLSVFSLHSAKQKELAARRRQLEQYLHDREEAVAEEIRQAILTMAAHIRMGTLARERSQTWEKKVKEVRERSLQGLASFAEITATHVDWLKARGDVLHEVMAWNIARAKLKQAQGLLALECTSALGNSCPMAAPPLLPLKVHLEQLLLEKPARFESGLEIALPQSQQLDRLPCYNSGVSLFIPQ
jgi:outer membrane protein TolC